MPEIKEKEETRPVGRPSTYDPKYCEMVIAHMTKGLSFESFAGVIDSTKQSLYRWREAHEEFRDAVDQAFSKCQIFWETHGVDGLYAQTERDADGNSTSRSMNATVWKFNMQNRFGWSDKIETKQTMVKTQKFKIGWSDDGSDTADSSKENTATKEDPKLEEKI